MKASPLVFQVEKIFRHARQGSIETRRAYKKCMLKFATWLAKNYNMQNLRNISNKHLAAYVAHNLSRGNAPSYIIKQLSAIRYTHDHLVNPRYSLEKNNQKLGVPKRVPPGDRAWKKWEFEFLLNLAQDLGKMWIADILILGWELGLRIHEAVRLYRNDAERALVNGYLHIKGKGGKIRQIPLSPLSEQALRRAAERVKRGARLFVPAGEKAHVVIARVQKFISDNRPTRDSEQNQLTAHGLRYSYAQRRMDSLTAQAMPRDEAELQVSKELGHNRKRVTRGYIC